MLQSYYPTAPRPQQPRGINHRGGGQGASGTPVVGMAGVGGGGGQPPAIYSHPTLPVQASAAMYISQSQVHGLHTPHQQSVYQMNNQIPIQVLKKHLCLYIYISCFVLVRISFIIENIFVILKYMFLN